MIFLKRYNHIKNFLYRFTILKIGNLHIRLHKISDKDRTSLYHNHPFNYISIILKGGYIESYIENDKILNKKHDFLSIIKRSHAIYHRIDALKETTYTLFIAYGKYDLAAYNTLSNSCDNGVYQRAVNNKLLWCKKENGIWYIGNVDKDIALKEKRHSIHQI